MLRALAIASLLVGSGALAACADASDGLDGTTSTEAPLTGVDGSTDSADRNCNVVLRDLQRNSTGLGGSFETVTSASGSTSWVWQGTVELSQAAADEGLAPYVLYRLGTSATWQAKAATPTGNATAPGFVQYTVRLSDGLPGPGWSGTAIAQANLQVAPYLQLPGGGRLFDHNRLVRDFDNYAIKQPDYAIWKDPNVCVPPSAPQRAKLVFAADWSERREGVIVPGGEITVAFDTSRLAQCNYTSGGHALYDISAHVKFATGDTAIERVVSVRDAAAIVAVPPIATGVTVWFEATSASGCHQYDSNLGANYAFDVARAPQWTGNLQNLITRDSSDPCDGGSSASQSFSFDTWARQRAWRSNLCFQVYQPGLTDHDDSQLWQKLDVAIKYRFMGQTDWSTRAVNFDQRVGNNARYLINWRELDPFQAYHCPPVTPRRSADGQYAQLGVEYYVVVNGGEVRPQPGAAFAGTFVDYLHDAWRDSNCTAPSL